MVLLREKRWLNEGTGPGEEGTGPGWIPVCVRFLLLLEQTTLKCSGFKTTQICCLTVVENRRPKIKLWIGPVVLLEAFVENLFTCLS